MRALNAAVLLLAICFYGPKANGENIPHVKIKNSEALAGPWEFADSSGVHGIFVEIETFSEGRPGNRAISSQKCQFEVYHRYLGTVKEGWFAVPAPNGRPDDSTTDFDGRHLRIYFTKTTELRPFDLDVTFHPVGRKWTGTWRWGGRTHEVVLTRPRPTGFCRSPFCGDWKGEPNPQSRFPFVPGSLHIRESSDGVYTAWLDRRMFGSEQADERDGEPLSLISLGKNAIVLEMSSVPLFRYSGKLAFDHLNGHWGTSTREGLQAPSYFIRVP